MVSAAAASQLCTSRRADARRKFAFNSRVDQAYQRRALQQEHYSTRTVNATSEYSRKFGEDILEVAGLSRVKPFLSDLI